MVDLVYHRDNGSVTFTCDIQTAIGNVGWIPIPLEVGPVFFRVRITAPRIETIDRWFTVIRDPGAPMMARVEESPGNVGAS